MASLLEVCRKYGWQLAHAQEPQVVEAKGAKNAAAQILVQEGVFVVTKRHTNGNSLVEFGGNTEEQVVRQIEAWEQEQVLTAAVPDPGEKAYAVSEENSKAATAQLASPTGGNKPQA